jgi:hypothetical protein
MLPKTTVDKGLTSRYNNDNEQNDDSCNQAHSHLHVLPPHLLANSVGTTAEALSRDCKVVGLVLEGVETFTTLGDLVDVLAHYADGIIDLLDKRSQPLI